MRTYERDQTRRLRAERGYSIAFLRKYFDVPDENIRLTCHLFADHVRRQREIEGFWLDVAQLPRESLCRSIVNVFSKVQLEEASKQAPLRNVPGRREQDSCRAEHLRRDPGVRGFDRPAWLDA